MVKKIILIILGLLGLLIGVPLALGGGGVLAVGGRDGSLQSGWHEVSTPTPALLTDASDLGNSNVQVNGTSVSIVVEAKDSSKPIFIGVGKAQDVENYLRGAANDEITKISFNPYKMETVRETGSLATLPSPANQNIWVAQASGTSPALTWKVAGDGNYRAVVMNADGTAGVRTQLSMGIKAPAIFGIGLGLLIAGLVLALIGLALLIWGIFAKRKKATPPAAPLVSPDGSPLPPSGQSLAPPPPPEFEPLSPYTEEEVVKWQEQPLSGQAPPSSPQPPSGQAQPQSLLPPQPPRE
jgi:hypothetical protein